MVEDDADRVGLGDIAAEGVELGGVVGRRLDSVEGAQCLGPTVEIVDADVLAGDPEGDTVGQRAGRVPQVAAHPTAEQHDQDGRQHDAPP